jgi:glycosyltransferase involved in cell wall biosynthesis
MIYLAYILLGFTVIQFLVALVNWIWREKYLNSSPETDLVSVLIPVRNEEDNIDNILKDLLDQDYKNIEIIIFNDLSTDNTPAIVEKFTSLDQRIRMINSKGLPDEWLGKNHACHSLSKYARGGYFLFLDADVRINHDLIIKSLNYFKKYDLGLLSIFPEQIMKSTGEKLVVPLMNYILLSLLPLILVRSTRFVSLSAANGQFMLFSADSYRETMPHEYMKSQRVEDIKIARFFKKLHFKVACLTGDENIRCHMYHSMNEAIIGFSKNVTMFFGNSFLLSILFWLVTTLSFLPIWIYLSVQMFVIYISLVILTRVIVSKVSHQSPLMNVLLLIPQQIVLGFIIIRALLFHHHKSYEWKGRNI